MERPDDPLVSLAWHGAFTSTIDGEHYYGRYATRDLFTKAELLPLIEQKLAKVLAADGYDILIPTREGLDEATRRYPREVEEADEKLAVLGLRHWERLDSEDYPVVGVYITHVSGADLLSNIAYALALTPRPPSVLLDTIGGVIPSTLADDLPGVSLEGAPGYELVALPDKLKPHTNIFQEYEFTLDIRPRNGTAVLFMTVGRTTRLLGPLSLNALTTAITTTSPRLAQVAQDLPLSTALAQYSEQPELAPLL